MIDRFLELGRRGPAFFVSLIAATLLVGACLMVLDQPLKSPAAPQGIVSFELADDGEKAAEILASWGCGEAGRSTAQSLLWSPKPVCSRAEGQLALDYLFLLLYSTTLALLLFRVAGGIVRAPWPRFGRPAGGLLVVVGLLQWVAGGLDAIENTALWLQIGGGASHGLAGLAAACARWKFGLIALGLVLLAVAALVLLLLAQRRAPVLQNLYFCRFPLLSALLLVALGPVSVLLVGSLLGNLFVFDRAWHLGVVVGLALLISWGLLLTLGNILRYGRFRFGVGPQPRRLLTFLSRYRLPVSVALCLPLLLTILYNSPLTPAEVLVGCGMGFLGAFLIFLVADFIQYALGSAATPPDEVLLPPARTIYRKVPVLRDLGPDSPASRSISGAGDPSAPRSRTRAAFVGALEGPGGTGYRRPDGKIRSGHVKAAYFFLASLTTYAVGYPLLRPDPSIEAGLRLPSLAYVLLLLMVVSWILPAISFFADRFRIPVVAGLLLLQVLVQSLVRADHFFDVTRAETAPADVQAAFDKLDETFGDDGPVVVVATSGGGIAASLWTARVLTGLGQELEVDEDDRFRRALRLISSVSGGSVGSLFYLDEVYASPRIERDIAVVSERVMDRAAGDCLDAAAWGLTYPDLWRGLVPLLARWQPERDRGWALEQVWLRHLRRPGAGLAAWARRVRKGELPPAVFNATVVETGQQFLFTPLEVPPAWEARSFFAEVPRGDLPLTTSARISATFPWVTPVTRARLRGFSAEDRRRAAWLTSQHLGDGGYYDNFGVVSAINWIESLLEQPRNGGDPKLRERLAERGIALILIRAGFDREEDPERRPPALQSKHGGWLTVSAGPVLALTNVRTSTQLRRNNLEVELLRQRWGAEGFPLKVFRFDLFDEGAPLSWKLTSKEEDRIRGAWDHETNVKERDRFKTCFADLAACPSPEQDSSGAEPPPEEVLAPG